MSRSLFSKLHQAINPDASPTRESNGEENPENAMATVSTFIEKLHAKVSSHHEKELITARVLGIAKAQKEARTVIGSHAQAMPLFVSILRNGTHGAKLNVAATLSVMSKDDDLRVKVLLGGCIPPLLSLLKSESPEARKAAAESIYEVSSGWPSDDHIGMKIFLTESVVPTLWDQLDPKNKQDKVVQGFVTGALRNLSSIKDSCWRTIVEDGGVKIIIKLLSSDNSFAQSNAASLLASLMLSFSDIIAQEIDAGTVKSLLELLEQKNDTSVRASAAEALEALTAKSEDARKDVVDANGVYLLIASVVAPPSKDGIQEGSIQALQTHATRALANIYGGMPALLLHLGQLSQSPRLSAPVADILGALAYALMIYDHDSDDADEEEPFDATKIEDILIKLLKPRDTKLFQERVLEAMASLYSNDDLKKWLNNADAKKLITLLATMATTADGHESLILSIIKLCRNKLGVWESIGKKEGIQMLISLLGLSSEQHQECAVELLLILTDQVDESKWGITAAGGIPPLVQLLEIGSQKAKEDAALLLWNLCCHSEDIHACVESAGAIPAFIWLLKTGGPKAQETSTMALLKLIRSADSSTINQLLPFLDDESLDSKSHVIRVLGHVLTLATEKDIGNMESPASKAVRSLVQVLTSPNRETQEYAAYILADLFTARQDISHSFSTNEIVDPCKKILNGDKTESVVKQLAQALAALSRPKKTKSSKKMTLLVDRDVIPLIDLAKTSPMESAESAVAALANILSDPHLAAEALGEDVVSGLTRVLGEGSSQGKKSAAQALHQLLKHFPVSEVISGSAQCRFVVLSVLESLNSMEKSGTDVTDGLEVVSLLTRTRQGANLEYQPWAALVEVPSSLEPLVYCLAKGSPVVQDKAIEILSRLCGEQPVLLGDLLIARSSSIAALAGRITNSPSSEVRVGGTALLICAAKEHKQKSLEEIDASGYLKPLIYNLVNMIKHNSRFSALEIEVQSPRGFYDRSIRRRRDEFDMVDPATVLGGTAALWLLAIISTFRAKNKLIAMEAGGLEVLSNKLSYYTSRPQAELEEDREGIWISALLLAVLFQDDKVVLSPASIRIVPSLAYLLRSDKLIDRFFASQALASLVCNGTKGISISIANSGAVTGLIPLIGYVESEMPNLATLSEEFSLAKNPAQLALERLFEEDDVRGGGSAAHKAIPLLVDLLRPIPDRPDALRIAVELLYRIAEGSDTNKLIMAEAGALEALTKYLSLNPRDSNEASISELLRVLFKNTDLIRHEVALSCLNHLIAVLRLSCRAAQFSAARALNELFNSEKIKNCDLAGQAVQPLIDLVNVAESESEQQSVLATLIKLTSGNNASKAALFVDVDGNALETMYRILSTASSSSLELKGSAAQVCYVLFSNKKFRETPIAPECIEPLISLIQSPSVSAAESAVWALERLLDDDQLVEHVSRNDMVLDLLIGLVSGIEYRLIEGSVSVLIKLGKDRAHRKQDMVRAGILDKCLDLLPHASMPCCSAIAELFRILTNSGAIARSPEAANIVEPLFDLLLQPDFSLWGQHSALHALVNILEKPQCLTTLRLTPSQTIEPLISFLESPTRELQHLGTELLSHLLAQEHFQQDIMTKNAVVPLVRLAGIGILTLQQTAVAALERISTSWPKEVADAGGIYEISKVIVQDDPEPSLELWEAAAIILSNLLRFNAEYYYRVPLLVLVRMLQSTLESTIKVALNALLVHDRADKSSAEQMVEAGVVDALLDLLRSHHCEELSGRLLEALFNKVRVREIKITKYAIAPLAQYLLDPQTTSETCKLLAALALGDLSQQEGHARSSDSVSACRALVSLLEDQPSEEMTMVSVCALQNFVMHSRTNRRAVAEAGGILVIQEMLMSPSADVAAQAAVLIKLLFSNHTLQEYVSTELVRSLTAALEREFVSAARMNIQILKAINVVFTNFAKLHVSEAATLCIPHLVTALKSDNEAARKCALDTLCVLKESWTAMPVDIAKSQAMIAAEAVSVLQSLSKACPPGSHDRADALLRCLPGCLTVTIKRGNNLKQANAFCQLTIGNSPQRQTKVVSNSNAPEWNESFTWAFDIAPRGQKLNIVCKSKGTFGKTTLGRVSVQIDKVITDGQYSGMVTLDNANESAKDDTSITLEIEIVWANRISD